MVDNRSSVTTIASPHTDPSWPPTSLPDITVGLTSKQGSAPLSTPGTYRLQANHFSLARASSRRVLHISHHEHSALPSPCTPLFAVYNCSSLRLSGQPSRQLRQSRSKTSIHSSTPSSSPVTTRHAAALHSSSGSPSSAVFSATKSKINRNSEMKHSTAVIAIAPNARVILLQQCKHLHIRNF
jgi:hypothetical protein